MRQNDESKSRQMGGGKKIDQLVNGASDKTRRENIRGWRRAGRARGNYVKEKTL